MDNLICRFFIVKINDQYYIFNEGAFMDTQGGFHTSEQAHLWLIDKAKEMSNSKVTVSCLEVERSFLFAQQKNPEV